MVMLEWMRPNYTPRYWFLANLGDVPQFDAAPTKIAPPPPKPYQRGQQRTQCSTSAQSDDVIDGDDDNNDQEARLAAANDEVTNFGQDTDGQSYDEEVDEDADELDAE